MQGDHADQTPFAESQILSQYFSKGSLIPISIGIKSGALYLFSSVSGDPLCSNRIMLTRALAYAVMRTKY